MFNQDKSLCIVYNGEIYNYVELKGELQQKGHVFVSHSDTEVVLQAYREWGTACFKRFDGMWALAIFDQKKKKLIFSRDRFGKKPFYFFKTKHELIFASEIKALLKHPHVVKAPNYEKIFRYLSMNYRYVDIDNASFFENIQQVPKSSYIEVSSDLRLATHTYWHIKPKELKHISEKEAIDTFRELFIDAVKLRLRSDVPVGCMLSGGMDSTSITCVAYKILKQPIITFSGITGQEKGVYDESDYINSVIKETNADFHFVQPDPADIFTTVDEMLAFHDEPICTVTWYSLYLIAKKIRNEKVPVVLNGHAGDELLAGYWDHYHYYFYELAQQKDVSALTREINCWKENHARNPQELGRSRDYIERMLHKKASESSRFPDYSACFQPELVRRYAREISLPNAMPSLLGRRLYSEMLYETVPAVLRPEDRNTMSQSIESRSPFLDYRLVEHCFSLPSSFKIRNGLGKWILREAMKGILPEIVRTRKDKSGFIAPADVWFRTINKKQLQDLINSPSFKRRGIFNVPYIQKIFDEHLTAVKNHQMFLWQLINLELWFRRFFDAPHP
jgi:asparagine synthase (glutamine-hydrolysing)